MLPVEWVAAEPPDNAAVEPKEEDEEEPLLRPPEGPALPWRFHPAMNLARSIVSGEGGSERDVDGEPSKFRLMVGQIAVPRVKRMAQGSKRWFGLGGGATISI